MQRAHPEQYRSKNQQNGGGNIKPVTATTLLMKPLIQKFLTVTMTHVCKAVGVKVYNAGTAQGFRGPNHSKDRVCLNFVCENLQWERLPAHTSVGKQAALRVRGAPGQDPEARGGQADGSKGATCGRAAAEAPAH